MESGVQLPTHNIQTPNHHFIEGIQMKTEQLADALVPWIRVDTWDTGHPMDDKRFHKALNSAFEDLGTALDAGDFEQAISLALDKHQPGVRTRSAATIEKFAIRAEAIASYLYDLSR